MYNSRMPIPRNDSATAVLGFVTVGLIAAVMAWRLVSAILAWCAG